MKNLINLILISILLQSFGLSLKYLRIGEGPGGNPTTRKIFYGKRGREKLLIGVSGPFCYLENKYVKTINLRVRDTGKAHEFICYKNNYKQKQNGAYSPLNDAHYYATASVEMYVAWFGKENLNIDLPIIVKVDKPHLNYMASCVCNHVNMYLSFGINYIDDDDVYPPTVADIVGHEVGHMITFYSSNLDSIGVSGGLNEAFSDWAGKALEYYLNETKNIKFVNNWTIGSGIYKKKGKSLRCLDNPPCNGHAIDHVNKYNSSFEIDGHSTSGIFSKAFYVMANKIGIKNMFIILYQANVKKYWKSEENFEGAAIGVLHAAEDCIQNKTVTGVDIMDIQVGFMVVGISCFRLALGFIKAWHCKISH